MISDNEKLEPTLIAVKTFEGGVRIFDERKWKNLMGNYG